MKQKTLRLVVYLYILLPIILFFCGWTKWFIALPAVAAIIYSIFVWLRADAHLWKPKTDKNFWFTVGLIFFVISLWVYFSGIGGLVFQNTDHICRNEIFNLLVEKKWPVVSTFEASTGTSTRFMTYYLGFWLPSAVVGKIFGLTAGYYFQVIWAILGVAIVYYLICERLGYVSVYPLIGMIFFSGLDIVGCFLMNIDINNLATWRHFEWWAEYFQYSSMTTQLFWVFNQAIYGWVLTLLILRQKDNRHIILIWSCGLLECTFPFVGMIPFLIYKLLQNRTSYRDLFTVENVVAGGFIGIISFYYVLDNAAAGAEGQSSYMTKGYIFIYVIFLLIEVGLYAMAIYRYQNKNILYWICLITLAICPLIHVGMAYDFCMRASVPALLIFMILYFETWKKTYVEGNKIAFSVILILFLLGSVTPIGEINRTVKETRALYESGNQIIKEVNSEEDIMTSINFSGKTEDSFFYKYLARK
jgi:hypothetical protein